MFRMRRAARQKNAHRCRVQLDEGNYATAKPHRIRHRQTAAYGMVIDMAHKSSAWIHEQRAHLEQIYKAPSGARAAAMWSSPACRPRHRAGGTSSKLLGVPSTATGRQMPRRSALLCVSASSSGWTTKIGPGAPTRSMLHRAPRVSEGYDAVKNTSPPMTDAKPIHHLPRRASPTAPHKRIDSRSGHPRGVPRCGHLVENHCHTDRNRYPHRRAVDK